MQMLKNAISCAFFLMYGEFEMPIEIITEEGKREVIHVSVADYLIGNLEHDFMYPSVRSLFEDVEGIFGVGSREIPCRTTRILFLMRKRVLEARRLTS